MEDRWEILNDIGSGPLPETIISPIELSNVKECHDKEIERIERLLRDGKTPITICGIAALDLHPHLSQLVSLGFVSWLGVQMRS